MIKNWLIKIFWNPFEEFCLLFPLIPIQFQIVAVAPGVQVIILNNAATKFLSRFGGGFDYAVIYLIDEELFFDTGYSWARRTLKNRVFKMINTKKIKYIVNSHDHEDHTGNNSLFSQNFQNAKIYTHPLAKMNIIFPPVKPWYRRFLFGPEKACAVEVLPAKFLLASNRVVEVIHTPGHTDGHVCLYDPINKILLTGDLFISESLDTQLEEANGPEWIKSLKKILMLDIDLILDGHGVIIKDEKCKERLKAKLDFLILLRSKVHEVASRGPVTQAELIKQINNTPGIINYLSLGEGWMSMITSGNFSRTNLIHGFLEEYLNLENEK